MENTIYTDSLGNAYNAIRIQWPEVKEILGHEHCGNAEDDQALCNWLEAKGRGRWHDSEGFIDRYGWGLIGTAISEN